MGAVEVQKDHELAVFDLGESTLAFLFLGEGGFLFALYALVGLIADFDDLYFGKSPQALFVFFFQHMERLVFHLSYTQYSDHGIPFPDI